MRQIKEVLRLRHVRHLSIRQIAGSCGLPVSTVGDYLQRARAAGLTWPLPDTLTQSQLFEQLLGAQRAAVPVAAERPLPDWSTVRAELRRPSVTLQLVWREYRQVHPEGYGYSQFCQLYRQWAAQLDPTLRQVQIPGEKMFVDWAGQTVPIYQSADGSTSVASVFVAVLGASNKTFAEAFPNQQLPAWISAHCHAYAYFGGVPKVTVPDNTRTGVVRPCRYEPLLHRSYQEMAEHYGTVIIPARIKRPRAKELASYCTS